ncbi:MAG: hypothetical protein ABIK79_11490 [Chloroflexota bacterium]|nr:hypothetical protein [Anaerolineae bacterium]
MRILIVGPCASGKTTLERRLARLGYDAHSCAQEHSYVPSMWSLVNKPDVLIYLDAQLSTIAQRSADHWDETYLQELRHRLRHARAHCDFYLATDDLAKDDVLKMVVKFLESRFAEEGMKKASPPPDLGDLQ